MNKKVCFIGHRHILHTQIKDRLTIAIQNEIDDGCFSFTMGSHGEFDCLALSECRRFRKKYKNIDIEVVITSYHKIANKLVDVITDEYGESEMIYDKNTCYIDVNTTMFEIEDLHFKRQITESNKQMIDGCDVMICYVDPKRYRSGAKTAMNYAKRQGLKVVNLYDEKDEPTYGMTKEQREEYYKNLLKEIKKK